MDHFTVLSRKHGGPFGTESRTCGQRGGGDSLETRSGPTRFVQSMGQSAGKLLVGVNFDMLIGSWIKVFPFRVTSGRISSDSNTFPRPFLCPHLQLTGRSPQPTRTEDPQSERRVVTPFDAHVGPPPVLTPRCNPKLDREGEGCGNSGRRLDEKRGQAEDGAERAGTRQGAAEWYK